MKEFIQEMRDQAVKEKDEANRLAPNSYGAGVEWGIIWACDKILEEISQEKTA